MKQALRSPFLWAFVVGCALVTSMRPLLRHVPPPPPVIGRVPRFSLVSESGASFGSDDLAGHVYVAGFFFTRCAARCTELMLGMAKLARRYRVEGLDSIRLVGVTTDPEFDTPRRLREAAHRWGADSTRWVLLTGSPEAIRHLAGSGFGGSIGPPAPTVDGGVHRFDGRTLFLVDENGRLRGRYGADELGLDEVFWRSRRVLDQAQAAEADR
jgi:protein SCO1/2